MRVCVSRAEREHTWPNIRTDIRGGKKERKEKKKKKERAVTSLSTTGEEAKAVKFKVRNLLPPVVETRAGVKAPPSKSLLDEVSRGFFVPPSSSVPPRHVPRLRYSRRRRRRYGGEGIRRRCTNVTCVTAVSR